MPEDIPSVEHTDILSYEELLSICESAADLGICKFKITGGEPLVRKGCAGFIERLKQLPGVRQVTLTSNGLLLEPYLERLKEAGIDGINISLDTLDEKKYKERSTDSFVSRQKLCPHGSEHESKLCGYERHQRR